MRRMYAGDAMVSRYQYLQLQAVNVLTLHGLLSQFSHSVFSCPTARCCEQVRLKRGFQRLRLERIQGQLWQAQV